MKRILLGRHAPLGVTLLAAALTVAACGGKDDDDGDGGDGDGDGDAVGGTMGDGDGDGDGAGGNTGGDGDGAGGNTGGDGDGAGGNGVGGNGVGGNGVGGSMGGEGGMGGETSGTGGETNTCDVTGDVVDFVVGARSDTAAAWDDNDFDDVTLATDECDIVSVTADWPHEAGYIDADPGEADMESTLFVLDTVTSDDLTGKTLTLMIKLIDDGRGNAAENGGYNINIGATDADYTEFATSYDLGQTGELYGAGSEATVTLDIPSDVSGFTPDDLYKIFIRIESKFWGDGSGSDTDNPMFDYDTAVFEISEWSVTDTP